MEAIRPVLKPILLFILLIFSISLEGCGRLKQVAGLGDFHANVKTGHLVASVVLTKQPTDEDVSVAIPRLPDSYVEVAPNPDTKQGGAIVIVSLALKSLSEAVGNPAFQNLGLPDGRALCGVSTATLPGFDFQANLFKFRFYLSDDVFGAFIPVHLPLYGSDPIETPIKDDRGYMIAYAYVVPALADGSGSGVLVYFPFVD